MHQQLIVIYGISASLDKQLQPFVEHNVGLLGIVVILKVMHPIFNKHTQTYH